MRCKNCGKEINDKELICPNCGIAQKQKQNGKQGRFLWEILGFFIPFIGLILFLGWRKSKPKVAKAVGKGVLINITLSIFLFITFSFFSTFMFVPYQ